MLSEQGYNTKLGWAMLVELEARFLEGIVVKMDKTHVLTQGFDVEPGWVG
jgi:hypothetical protein